MYHIPKTYYYIPKICYNNYIHVYTLQVFISKHIYTCTSCKLLSIHVPGHDFIVPANQAFAGLELTPDLLHSACANLQTVRNGLLCSIVYS